MLSNFISRILLTFQNKMVKQIARFKELASLLENEGMYRKELSEKKMLLSNLKTKNESITSEANVSVSFIK